MRSYSFLHLLNDDCLLLCDITHHGDKVLWSTIFVLLSVSMSLSGVPVTWSARCVGFNVWGPFYWFIEQGKLNQAQLKYLNRFFKWFDKCYWQKKHVTFLDCTSLHGFSKHSREQYEKLSTMHKNMQKLYESLGSYYAFDPHVLSVEDFFGDLASFRSLFVVSTAHIQVVLFGKDGKYILPVRSWHTHTHTNTRTCCFFLNLSSVSVGRSTKIGVVCVPLKFEVEMMHQYWMLLACYIQWSAL